MARYYFHIFDDDEALDHEGIDLDRIDDARTYMLTIAKLWIEQEEHKVALWTVEARDEQRKLVGMVRFGYEPDNEG